MEHSEHTHEQDHGCTCDHSHEHKQAYRPLVKRWLLSVFIVGALLMLLRPFIIGQLLVRETSYATSLSFPNEIRISQKTLAIDNKNIQAWTDLGYAYMDGSQIDHAISAFKKVILLNPEDKGAASFELGQAYYAKGDYLKASGYFERVRSAGPRASNLLEADILKYRHGTMGFRSLNSIQTLLEDLEQCYKQTGNSARAADVQKEYEYYKNKHSKILF